MTALLEVTDLNVTFETGDVRVPAVRGTTYQIDAGEVVAIVGESGSGKSTAAMAVIGLLPEYANVSGSVRLHGEELLGRSDQAMSRHPRQDDRHRVSGPDVGADPRLHRRRPDRRSHPGAQQRHQPRGRPQARRRAAGAGRHRAAATPGEGLPARAVRRRAPAGGHRDRDRQRSRPVDLRRADHRAGRHRAGANPRRAAHRARRHRRRRADHHPRPGCGLGVRRPGDGHVRRTRGRGRRRRTIFIATAGCPTRPGCWDRCRDWTPRRAPG